MRAAVRESSAVRRQRADGAELPGVRQVLGTWLRTEGRVAMAIGCASIVLSIFLMMAQVIGMIRGLCILGVGAGLIGRTYRPELSIARGVCAWLGGAFAMFTFLGIGYSFVVSFFSLLFALGLFYASFAEDFLDL